MTILRKINWKKVRQAISNYIEETLEYAWACGTVQTKGKKR